MTVQELLEKARAAIAESKLDEADGFTKQARALIEVEKAAKSATPVRLALGGTGEETAGGQAAMKAWYVKKYGELPVAAEQIARELYAGIGNTNDYIHLTWMKRADFQRFLRYGISDPVFKSLVLLTPSQILDAAANGISVAEIKATMIEAQDTLGGYLVPEDFRATIIERLPGLTVVRPLATVITTSRDRVPMPVSTGGGNQYTGAVRVTWVDESPAGTEAATNATFGIVNIPVHVTMAHTALSMNLLEDSAFNLVDYMARQFSQAMAIDEDTQFLVGNGTGRPQGVLNGTAANGAPHDSNVTTVNSGAAAALTGDGIVKIPYGLAGQYRQAGAVWVMAKATFQEVSLLKDGQGRYLWRAHDDNLAAGQPDRLQGYAVRESESMPAIAANKYPIIFGDFTGYTIADRIGMSVNRYEDSTTAKSNQVVYVARRRLGGQVTEGWRYVVQKVAA